MDKTPKTPAIGQQVQYRNAFKELRPATVIRVFHLEGSPTPVATLKLPAGHTADVAVTDLVFSDSATPTGKKVRSIRRKLDDIADAAWCHGNISPRGEENGLMGRDAERRVTRMHQQIETLAALAIQGKLLLSDARMAEVMAHPTRDEILAEALVGNWAAVRNLVEAVLQAAQQATLGAESAPGSRECCVTGECESNGTDQAGDLADPLTGQAVSLEPRDPKSPLNFPCCGGLRPAHASNCRQQ